MDSVVSLCYLNLLIRLIYLLFQKKTDKNNSRSRKIADAAKTSLNFEKKIQNINTRSIFKR